MAAHANVKAVEGFVRSWRPQIIFVVLFAIPVIAALLMIEGNRELVPRETAHEFFGAIRPELTVKSPAALAG